MPTFKGMFRVSRAGKAFVAASLAVGVMVPAAALAATTSSSIAPASSSSSAPSTAPATSVPAPTTTVPDRDPSHLPDPPPAFTLPSEFGYALVKVMNEAKIELADAKKALPGADKALAAAKRHNAAVQKQLQKTTAKAETTLRKLERSRKKLRTVAASAYMNAGGGQMIAAISSIINTNSIVEAGSQMHTIGTYGTQEKRTLDEYVALKKQVDKQLAEISEQAEDAKQDLAAAKKRAKDLRLQIADAKTKLMGSIDGINKFHAAATSALSPILGPSRLTAKQMAGYVMANGGRPRITIPLEELAQIYLDEGLRTGVRGDVAFAQSILETGSFANPGSSSSDNNFSGIGWCDSCAHGYNFDSARAGVRAQLQLLRIYVDPNFPDASYTDEILLKGTLTLGFRGDVQTWWDLWGTWATGALYGQHVYDIYERMVAYSALHPDDGKTPVPTTPVKEPARDGVTRPGGTGPGTK
jgi:hypothetical protein